MMEELLKLTSAPAPKSGGDGDKATGDTGGEANDGDAMAVVEAEAEETDPVEACVPYASLDLETRVAVGELVCGLALESHRLR